jgi:uncharacterized protein
MEQAVRFRVGDDELLGILHPGWDSSARGVLIVVGGPQYRVGSHRQFLLLARYLASANVPVFRFDYRGMGDSDGAMRDFETVDEDIRVAIDTFQANTPGLQEVVIWGLCDAASAALSYAHRDDRVSGLVLLNPWVRTEQGLAKAYFKTYYLQRLVSRDFWAGLLHGRFNPVASVRSLAGMVLRVAAPGGRQATVLGDGDPLEAGSLPERMAAGWERFHGPILLILSGDDLTAAEFRDTTATSPAWQGLLDQPRVTVRELPEANHTFSRREWRDQVAQWTLEWVSGSGKGEMGRGK